MHALKVTTMPEAVGSYFPWRLKSSCKTPQHIRTSN